MLPGDDDDEVAEDVYMSMLNYDRRLKSMSWLKSEHRLIVDTPKEDRWPESERDSLNYYYSMDSCHHIRIFHPLFESS